MVNSKIQRLHRSGNIQPEHDIDAVRGDLGSAMSSLRTGESDDHQSAGKKRQRPYQNTDPAAAAAHNPACEADIGIFDGRDRTAPPTPEHHNRQQGHQPKPFRLQEARHEPPEPWTPLPAWPLPTRKCARSGAALPYSAW